MTPWQQLRGISLFATLGIQDIPFLLFIFNLRLAILVTLYAACASAWTVKWHKDKKCADDTGSATGTKARACTDFDSDVTIHSVSAKNLGDTWRVRVFTEKACGGTGENIDHTQDICIEPGIWKDQNEWKSYKFQSIIS
ncbi:hypothetical protein N7528_001302 [Penicillium herquei]|nr:hypothetical protein N7528_001302 [Penicillium herquei]